MKWLVLALLLLLAGCSALDPDDFLKEDGYLTYTYEGENLPAGLTYREIDYYTNIVLLHDLYGVEEDNIHEIKERLQKFLAFAHGAQIHNTLKKQPGRGRVALDTFCIVGWLLEDERAGVRVSSHITSTGNLMNDDYYGQDHWRNLADELWCIMLLERVDYDDEARDLMQDKFREADRFLANAAYTPEEKAGVAIHMLLALAEFSGYEAEKERWVREGLAVLEEPALADNNLVLANTVDALLFHLDDPSFVEGTVETLKEREQDGIWVPTEGMEIGYGHLFATPRVELAIAHHEAASS